MIRMTAAVLAVVALLAGGCSTQAQGTTDREPLLVGAASDLLPAFTEIGERFAQQTGEHVTFVFGSSGKLAQQIIEGAPLDVFASADAALVGTVLDSGRGDAATQATYALGRLAIWAPEDAWGGWETLADLADDPALGTIALAHPEHAPYGRAAQEAMERLGVLDRLAGRLVYGESVSDAQRLAASGNVDAGVIALSLALAADERGEGRWVLVDADLHAPLRHDLAVVATDPQRAALAARFIEFAGSEDGRAVMRRYGFVVPDDAQG